MALKRTTPISKVAPNPAQRGAEVKAAAQAAPADDDDRTYTHQGPGTGAAGQADHQASAAILRSARGIAPAAGAEPVSPAEPERVAPVVETKAAPVEAASEALRERLADDKLKLGASGDEASTTIPEPRTPGEQAGDSGTAGASPPPGGSGTSSGGGATSEGGRDPFGGVLTERLDAATAGALSQLDAARPNLRGGLDVFQSAPGAATTPSGAGSGPAGHVLTGPGNQPAGSDGGAENAADAVGQVTAGPGSTGTLFGDRIAGAQSDLSIAGGLIGDQTARASSPSAADGGNLVVDRALSLAEKAADGDDDAYRKLETLANEMHKGRTGTDEATGGIGYGARVNADGELVAPSGSKAPAEESPFWRSVADMFTGSKELSGKSTLHGEALQQALEDQDQLEDPGDPNNPEGDKPTPAQIAFRQALRDSLGAGQPGSGDIDPADNGGAPATAGVFAGASNDNLGLVGQPDEMATSGGTMRGPSTGADVDPVEGSAFSGPALGGNPEDLSFGSTTLGIDAARGVTTTQDDEDDSDKEEDDDE